jgi:hypothetical protein
MKILVWILVSLLSVTLAGCVHPPADLGASQQNREWEDSGWPFRWKIAKINGGTSMTRAMLPLPSGRTKADAALKQEILNHIGKAWFYQHVRPAELEDVRLMPDGREVWILKDPTGGRAYVITLFSSPRGGRRFSISDLIAFQKKGT